jgi:hypothetical protein
MKKKVQFHLHLFKKLLDSTILDWFQKKFFRGPGTIKPITPGPDKMFPRAACCADLLKRLQLYPITLTLNAEVRELHEVLRHTQYYELAHPVLWTGTPSTMNWHTQYYELAHPVLWTGTPSTMNCHTQYYELAHPVLWTGTPNTMNWHTQYYELAHRLRITK